MKGSNRIEELKGTLRKINQLIADEISMLRAAAEPSADLDDPDAQLALADSDLKDYYDLRDKIEAELNEEQAKADSSEYLGGRAKSSRPN